MIAGALVALYFGGLVLLALVAVAAALMLVEWGDMHRFDRRWSAAAALLLILQLGAEQALHATPFSQSWLWFGAIVLVGLLIGIARRDGRLGWGYVYVGIPALSLILLYRLGWAPVFWALIVTWATDIFAYFVGRLIGGPKLAPRISPNKTWAGLVGGAAGASAVGYATAAALGLPSPFMVAGSIMALLAQAGDLYESGVKRRAGVKDSSRLLPGHGGVLDRLDGLLPVIVATFLLWSALA